MLIECEVKVCVDDLDVVWLCFVDVGVELFELWLREINIFFDCEGEFQGYGCVLCVCCDGQGVRVIFKGFVIFEVQVKSCIEFEIFVGDVDCLEEILIVFGFKVILCYEKDCEQWCLGDVVVVFDYILFGDFVEVEVEELLGYLVLLGFDGVELECFSYVGFWFEVCVGDFSFIVDMVFFFVIGDDFVESY